MEALKDEELLAILLGTGYRGKSVVSLARSILKKFPPEKLLSMPLKELQKIKGLGTAKSSTLTASFELAKRALHRGLDLLPVVQKPADLLPVISDMRTLRKEHFRAIYLNARNQVVHTETVSIGHLSGSLVHPREVFTPAYTNAAAGVIVAHNHPSGDPAPSREDLSITKQLMDAGTILGIDLLDHVIVGKNSLYSLKEHGQM